MKDECATNISDQVFSIYSLQLTWHLKLMPQDLSYGGQIRTAQCHDARDRNNLRVVEAVKSWWSGFDGP